MSEEFKICDKALDRCHKKDVFRRDYQRCLENRVCPQCGDDLLLVERNAINGFKTREQAINAMQCGDSITEKSHIKCWSTFKCSNSECNFSTEKKRRV
ncbi:hypothetical protein A2Z67_04790 [Candidatus Woesebacteria bacterium RBG_13_36_22]|uniref:Uncharacterized protein n=1 Tax=Candidatus Woesebacteria bacterium RBG_13_36_22 TaxID=1802478 RepID=A0A1F7X2L6_9BACT|nr:MAG: hypothetical protein A2Z67_04790 [Candidatus Woesebacteria bacterium RBG_13_36_22]